MWRTKKMVNFELLNKIEETPSILEKKQIFKEFCSDENNREFVYLAFNNVEYSIAKKIIDDTIQEVKNINNDWFREEVSDKQATMRIKELVNYSGNDLKKKLIGLFSCLNEQQTKWFRRAILHNLEMGFNEKLVNYVLTQLGYEEVYLFKQPQLCDTIRTEGTKILFPEKLPDVIVEEKLDGVRVLVIKKEDEVKIISRNGKPYRFSLIEDDLKKIRHDFIIDGEIVYTKGKDAVSSFQKLMTMLRTKEETLDNNIKLFVFDIIEFDYNDITSKPLITRKKILEDFFDKFMVCVKLMPFENYLTKETIQKKYDEIISRGGEGLILKDKNSTYEYESRKNWWKIKGMIDETFEIINYGYGVGKTNRNFVAFIEVIVDGKKTCRVGSGITDEISNWMTRNSGKLIGMKVDIQYTEKTKDGLLRFPRFSKFREDLK